MDRKTINARTLGIIEGKGAYPVSTLGGRQRVSIISEGGLYKLTISKTGSYTMPGAGN